ncbi:hypothetical protein [Nitrosophilus kaiyonis]|uniref:hypothetical protein n=1 Tax=Nitrosophilus kaiyonis TaxID=2930200 RepID=UPI0024930FE7|nr:hypothetical protein [Nitrosophilus kaiyonis]
MFSKRIIFAFLFIFIFLSAIALITNMPQKKNIRVYNAIMPYFPYKIQKEFGGLDIVDKRTGKDLDIANEKVFLAFDNLLKKWGKSHLKLENNTLLVLDDNGKIVKKIELKNEKEKKWVETFFFSK